MRQPGFQRIHYSLGLLVCTVGVSAVARAAEISARLQNDQIFLGAQGVLTVSVLGQQEQEWPEVNFKEPGLRVERRGTQFMVFNGVARNIYQFAVIPERTGTFIIPVVSVRIGNETITDGPLTLRVTEAAVLFLGAQLEPQEIAVGETAVLTLTYQGIRPNAVPTVPEIAGLTISATAPPQPQINPRTGIPLTVLTFSVTARELGTFNIQGIVFEGIPSGPASLTVSPFVISGTRMGERSLSVGAQTKFEVQIRGLKPKDAPELVTTGGVNVSPAQRVPTTGAGPPIFAFMLTPTEPGNPAIVAIRMPGGHQATLNPPITLSVQQAGESGVLVCRGKSRKEETVVGEPFIVDFEVFYRGDLRSARVNIAGTAFADKPYIKCEPLVDLNYPDWPGQRVDIGYNQQERMPALLGTGELNGQKEQMIRFGLKITPLSTGDLPLGGVEVTLGLRVVRRSGGGGMFFSSDTIEPFTRTAEAGVQRVIDPPGQSAPPGYRGAVGEFTFTTQLDRTTAAAMSPLTLTMKISGETVNPMLRPPVITEVPELTRDFDVSPTVSEGETEGNTITFTQTIRPRSESVKQLPSLPLAAYNYKKQKYEIVYSLPIPITVTPGSVVGAGAMQIAALPQQTPATTAEPSPVTTGSALALGANYASLGDVTPRRVLGTGTVASILFAGPLAIVAVWAGRRLGAAYAPTARLRHERRAILSRLDDLRAIENFPAGLADVIQSYLRVALSLPPGELSMDMLDEAFRRHAVSDEWFRETRDLLTWCDAGRFAPAAIDAGEKTRVTQKAREILSKLERVVA